MGVCVYAAAAFGTRVICLVTDALQTTLASLLVNLWLCVQYVRMCKRHVVVIERLPLYKHHILVLTVIESSAFCHKHHP